PTDEAGSVGAALDAYANRVQQQQTELETRLRKQREETYQLFGVLESLQSAVIVQDGSGQITLMNAPARALCNGLAPAQLRATLQSSPATLQGRRYTLAVSALKSTGGHSGRVITLTAVDGTPAAAPIIKEAPAVTLTQALQVRGVALAELIEGMRDLSAPDDHSPALTPKPILLETLLWAAANEWRQVAQAAGLSLHVQLNVRGLVILADERRLRWALGNLLDNAVKYTLQGGVVILEVKEQAANHVIVRVRDSGVGISAPDLAQIGAGYFRGTPTTPDGHVIRVAGAGQGILAARQIIAAHNGTLELRSTVGVGTAVYIRLPLTDARALDLPLLPGDDEGETVQLPEG
ncbi:MAG: sensor histidine kinase, partial [Phototrophicaceae bacterium]